MSSVMNYCALDKKTNHNGVKYVTGLNCTAQSAYSDFISTKLMHHKDSGKMFFHLVRSFEKGEEVKPEIAHEMALKLAEHFKDYEVIISTHFDTMENQSESSMVNNPTSHIVGGVFRLMGNMDTADNTPASTPWAKIDSKSLAKYLEKRRALGQKITQNTFINLGMGTY